MGDDLKDRIDAARERLEAKNRPSAAVNGKGMGVGLRMASDFVAAIIVGAVLGWGIDAVFGVSPWGLVVCLVLGFITGVRNVVREASRVQSGADAQPAPGEPGRNEGE